MKVIGIDPGTRSFDFFGVDGENIFLDCSVSSEDVADKPGVIFDTIKPFLPVEIIVGPSGYGLPLTSIRDLTERDLALMIPLDRSVAVNEGIHKAVMLMKEEKLPVVFTPGVIHLPTVPDFRKANKIDMGTADKVCSVALGIKDEAEHFGIDYRRTRFIQAELGYGFNAVIAVEEGKIVDGIGGTSGGPGFLTLGSMDSELAMRLPKFPQAVLFSGGCREMCGRDDISPEEMVCDRISYSSGWNMMMESVAKSVALMTVIIQNPREILISGRLSDIPGMMPALEEKLSPFGPVRKVKRRAKVAKDAAEGAAVIGEGLLRGKCRDIVDGLQLKHAGGTMFDHVLIKGMDFQKTESCS